MKLGKAVGAAGVAAGGFSLFQAANFEAELNKLNAFVKKKIKNPIKKENGDENWTEFIEVAVSKEELKVLSDKAEKINSASQFTGEEALRAMKYIAMAEYKYKDIQKIAQPTLDLAGAAKLNSDISLKDTADIFTNIMTPYAIPAEKARDAADMLAYSFSSANTTLDEFGNAMVVSMASIAKESGLDFVTSLALLMSAAGTGTKGEKAGTAFASVFSRLMVLPPEAEKILAKRGITAEKRIIFRRRWKD